MSLNVATIASLTNASSTSTAFVYAGGEKTVAIYGDFDGGTVKIQASLAEGSSNFIYLKDNSGADLAFTEVSIFKLDIGKCQIRFISTGHSSDLSVTIKAS